MKSITFQLPPFNIFEMRDIIQTIFDPLYNEIMDAYNAHIAALESLREQRREQSLVSGIMSDVQGLEHLNIARALWLYVAGSQH
jgi:hypothetical protein